MVNPEHIVVVGAGVMGLTSALRLLQSGYEVTVVADQFNGITSKTAPSAFRPTKLGDIPTERLVQWGRKSRDFFTKLFREEGSNAGLTLVPTIEPFRPDLHETVGGADVLSQVCPEYRKATRHELEAWCPDGGQGWQGIVYTSFTIEGAKFLPYLIKRIESLAGRIVEATVIGVPTSEDWCESAASLAGRDDTRMVVNCCGLRAGTDCEALRGTLVLVKAPWLRWAVCNYDAEDPQKPTWIVPRANHVMLGTSKFPGGKDSMIPGEEDETAKSIIERCSKFIPALRDAPIISVVTCVRPNRLGGARVDCVQTEKYICVNNYGHSTVGATYSWGCACDVNDLVQKALSGATNSSRL